MKTNRTPLLRLAALGILFLSSLGWSGCATTQPVAVRRYPIESLNLDASPKPERVGPFEGLHRAAAYVAAHPGSDYMVGSGDSMLPLYKDHTVIITERQPMDSLKVGMTVVFIGESGMPVAHTLVEKTSRGWVTQGLGNTEPDRVMVRSGNYLGTVIRAFEPSENPMVAILRHRPTGALASSE